MLKYLKADNYKTFVNFSIEFPQTGLIIGRNGSGKSTVFELIRILRDFVNDSERIESLFPQNTLTRWQQVNVQSFSLGISNDSHDYDYSLIVEQNLDEKKCRIAKESVKCDGNLIFKEENGHARLYNDSYNEGPEILADWTISGVSLVHDRGDNKRLKEFKEEISKLIICSPRPFLMSSFSDHEDLRPNYVFSNISAVYAKMSGGHTELIFDFWNTLKGIYPEFRSSSLEGSENNKTLYVKYQVNGSNNFFSYNFNELSDGERMLFALYFLTIVYSSLGCTVLLDEPDNYISLHEVQQWMQEMEERFSETGQCVLISHNASIIDYIGPEQTIWMRRRSYGASEIMDSPAGDPEDPMTQSEYLIRGLDNDA